MGYFSSGLWSRSGGALAQQLSALTMFGRGALQSSGEDAEWSGHFQEPRLRPSADTNGLTLDPTVLIKCQQLRASSSRPKHLQAGPDICQDFAAWGRKVSSVFGVCRTGRRSVPASADGEDGSDGYPWDRSPWLDVRPGPGKWVEGPSNLDSPGCGNSGSMARRRIRGSSSPPFGLSRLSCSSFHSCSGAAPA